MPKREVDTSYQMVFPSQAVSFDPEAFDDFIASHGIEFVHWKALPCPVGMIDPDDIMRRPHEHHANCSNGFLYKRAGTFTTSFLQNTSDFKFIDPGLLDGSTVSICVPRFYDDAGGAVDVSQFDRLYLKQEQVTVTTKHTFAHHVTGVDKLMFPVVAVDWLVDARGQEYALGVDFDIKGGQLVWRDQRAPGVDPKTGKGQVCSVRYSYRPFWYVKTLPHEVRVAQIEDAASGTRTVERMPQAALLQREYIFEKEQQDPQAPQNLKLAGQHPAPESGRFGPR